MCIPLFTMSLNHCPPISSSIHLSAATRINVSPIPSVRDIFPGSVSSSASTTRALKDVRVGTSATRYPREIREARVRYDNDVPGTHYSFTHHRIRLNHGQECPTGLGSNLCPPTDIFARLSRETRVRQRGQSPLSTCRAEKEDKQGRHFAE